MDRNSTLLLDVGNLLFYRYKDTDSYGYAEKNRIITEAMNRMAYDGLNLNPNDLFPETRFLEERCRNAQFPLISANVSLLEICTDRPVKFIIKEINGIRIGITGIMPGTEQVSTDSRFRIDDPETALKEILPDLTAAADYIVLMSGLTSQDTYNLLTKIPEIDLGLCISSIPMPLPAADRKNSGDDNTPVVMTVNTKGYEIGILTIEKMKDGPVNISNAEVLLLDDTIKDDEKMVELVNQFKVWETENSQKKQEAELEERKKQVHQKLLENLELSPEEYFNRMNQSQSE